MDEPFIPPPFRIYGPFVIENKEKIHDLEYQKAFWRDCVDDDEDRYELSLAKGIYLFSLKNAENYNPQYVGMTGANFKQEVFNKKNIVMIDHNFKDGRFDWGKLSLHLLAKPKTAHRGFSINIDGDELYWIEDFIQQMCRIKNPQLYNIGKKNFLLKTAIEGITDGTVSKGIPPERIRTFRNVIGFDD